MQRLYCSERKKIHCPQILCWIMLLFFIKCPVRKAHNLVDGFKCGCVCGIGIMDKQYHHLPLCMCPVYVYFLHAVTQWACASLPSIHVI